jgi:hypothetical protein
MTLLGCYDRGLCRGNQRPHRFAGDTPRLSESPAPAFQMKFIRILAYDYSLTLSSEVVHIWANQFITYSTLFLVTRYLPFFDSAIIFARKFYF